MEKNILKKTKFFMSMHGYTKPTDVNGKTAIGPKVDEGI